MREVGAGMRYPDRRESTLLRVALALAVGAMVWVPAQVSVTASYRFVIHSGLHVLDASTGLLWQQAVNLTPKTWQQALAYCEGLEMGGYDDWRVPNIRELYTLADYHLGAPYIDTLAFGTAHDLPVWSSTTNDTTSYFDEAWAVDFGAGRKFPFIKAEQLLVRCVRGGT